MSLNPVKHHISIAVYCCDLWRPWLVVVPTIAGQPVVVHHHPGPAQRGLQVLQYYQWPIDMEARHRGGSLLQSIYLINCLCAICSTGLARLGLQFKAQIWEGVQSVQPRFEISKQGSSTISSTDLAWRGSIIPFLYQIDAPKIHLDFCLVLGTIPPLDAN